MMRTGLPLLLAGCALVFLVCGRTPAADEARFDPLRTLYVSPSGSDDNDGLSPAKPLRTIGKAATLVRPGDLVLVSGGTYREQVHLKTAGTAEQPIVFRAAEGQTTLVTWEERPTGWRLAETRACYVAGCEQTPRLVWEDATLTEYTEVFTVEDLGTMPGSYLFDAQQERLNVHPMSGLTADKAAVVVVPALLGADDRTALNDGFVMMADFNRVEGFTLAYQPFGIRLTAAHCVVRDNTIYACLVGIWGYHAENSVIERNRCFRNINNGINLFSAKNMLVQDNFLKHNDNQGPTIHSGDDLGLVMNMSAYRSCENCTFRRNVVIARHFTEAWRYKYVAGECITEGNVIVGGDVQINRWAPTTNNTVIGGALLAEETPMTPEAATESGTAVKGNLVLAAAQEAAAGFANPLREDYRLHTGSPYLGQGAHAEAADVTYVSRDGDDARDGRSPAAAFEHVARALAVAGPGATIYVMPGTYNETLVISTKGTADKPLVLMSYGGGDTVLDGADRLETGIVIRSAGRVVVDGLVLKGFTAASVTVDESGDVDLKNMVLDGSTCGMSARASASLRIANNSFVDCSPAVTAEDMTGGLELRNNLFRGTDENAETVALDDPSRKHLVSERNAFGGPRAAERLNRWRQRVREAHPSVAVSGDLAEDYRPSDQNALAFGGVGHRAIGARTFVDAWPIPVESFVVRQALPSRAILTWDTPFDYADATVTWGGGDLRGAAQFTQGRDMKTVRGVAVLNGLQPETTYDVLLAAESVDGGRRAQERVSFTTPKTVRPPTTLYVAPWGSDADPGTDFKRPLRTLMAASYAAVPGDEVLVFPGAYNEHLVIFSGGVSKDRPTVFRSIKPGAAVIECGKIRASAIWVLPITGSDSEEEEQAARARVRENNMAVSHLVIDGFRMRNMKYVKGSDHIVILNDASDVQFVNNIYEAAPLAAIKLPLQLNNCHGVLIRNNVFVHGIGFIEDWWGRSNDIVIDHNTFQGPGKGRGGNYCVYLMNISPDLRVRVTNNIFGSPIQFNKSQPIVRLGRPTEGVVVDYNLYWRDNESAKPYKYASHLFGFKEDDQDRKPAFTIEDVRELYGFEMHGKFVAPMFVDPYNGDYRLKPGSPAIGMGEDGSTVGATLPE